MSAQVRLDAVIVAAGRFLTSPDIGSRSSVTERYVVIDVMVRTAWRSAGPPADRSHLCHDQPLQFRAAELCRTFAGR
jgi:hypothetical protein